MNVKDLISALRSSSLTVKPLLILTKKDDVNFVKVLSQSTKTNSSQATRLWELLLPNISTWLCVGSRVVKRKGQTAKSIALMSYTNHDKSFSTAKDYRIKTFDINFLAFESNVTVFWCWSKWIWNRYYFRFRNIISIQSNSCIDLQCALNRSHINNYPFAKI